MKVKSLNIQNYRNIEKIEIFPCDTMNVICGENAQGKTNLLESIWLFTGAKSFRNSKDSAFVKFGKEKAICNLLFLANSVELQAKLEIDEKRTAFINEKKLKSPSLLAGNFNAVVFSPNDLSIVKDGPAIRRRFLDIAIGQLYPSYIEILREYARAITQRNKIIKDYKYDSTLSIMLDVFEEEISQKGEKIILYRKKYIEMLNKYLPSIYFGLSGEKENLDTFYIKSSNDKNLKEQLLLSRKEDMFSGSTSIGPHRDDIEFKINGINARNFGSQGQKRSVALSLKLAEAEVIKNNTGEFPIFLLDDVMSELDPTRQNFILNHIEGMQTFLTCCDPSNFKNLKAGKIFNIEKGCVF